MAVGVIDRLEAIEIDRQRRRAGWFGARAGAIHRGIELAAIEQAGQRVCHGAGFGVLDPVADGPAELQHGEAEAERHDIMVELDIGRQLEHAGIQPDRREDTRRPGHQDSACAMNAPAMQHPDTDQNGDRNKDGCSHVDQAGDRIRQECVEPGQHRESTHGLHGCVEGGPAVAQVEEGRDEQSGERRDSPLQDVDQQHGADVAVGPEE